MIEELWDYAFYIAIIAYSYASKTTASYHITDHVSYERPLRMRLTYRPFTQRHRAIGG